MEMRTFAMNFDDTRSSSSTTWSCVVVMLVAKANSTLQEINLVCNEIGDEEGKSLTGALLANAYAIAEALFM